MCSPFYPPEELPARNGMTRFRAANKTVQPRRRFLRPWESRTVVRFCQGHLVDVAGKGAADQLGLPFKSRPEPVVHDRSRQFRAPVVLRLGAHSGDKSRMGRLATQRLHIALDGTIRIGERDLFEAGSGFARPADPLAEGKFHPVGANQRRTGHPADRR